MHDLIAGERAAIAGGQTFVLTGDGGDPPLLTLLGLGTDRRTAPTFAPIDSWTRELRPAVKVETETTMRIDLAAMPADVDRLVLVAFDPGNRPLARRLAVATDALRFSVDLRDRADAAVILIECYRHQGAWRLAANGQGFATGLSAIAVAYGIDPAWAARFNPRLGGDTQDDIPPRNGSGSGSGVAVERNHILTNAHVVEEARAVSVHVGGRSCVGEVVFADPRNDLALLHVATTLPGVAQFRSQVGLHLGEDIVALGFPLQGLLGTGPQASAGNIAALTGIGNDSSLFQFNAPIASGNSGGPILDMAGHLVGVVCSSLNLDRIRQSGANGENINFGIRGAMMLSFLDAFGIEPHMARATDQAIGRAAVVRKARDVIARITVEC
ncbi:trypsin-like peptidase domain-containing protein [Sphingomonas sp. T9W2]|uniref:trypsin-like peptidase domain-containing protein n=1 Tax=Sphingomonas sp. T9W2 TaxID=3143183 RepID=UPI0031F59910